MHIKGLAYCHNRGSAKYMLAFISIGDESLYPFCLWPFGTIQQNYPITQAYLWSLFCLFIFRERGMEGERGGEKPILRETSIHCLSLPELGAWSVTQTCALTKNRTGDPLLLSLAFSPPSHTSQGLWQFFWTFLIDTTLLSSSPHSPPVISGLCIQPSDSNLASPLVQELCIWFPVFDCGYFFMVLGLDGSLILPRAWGLILP